MTLHRFGLFPVRSPLLGESSFLSLPAGTEMFQFSAFPPHYAVPGHQSWSVTRSRKSSDHSLLSGSPKLIAAMLRPSSALDAKASTIHSSKLNHCFLNRDATFETVHLVFKEPHALSRGVVVFLLRVPARESGGGDGTRTHDRLVANQVLYQLSYAPRVPAWSPRARGPPRADIDIRLERTPRSASS